MARFSFFLIFFLFSLNSIAFDSVAFLDRTHDSLSTGWKGTNARIDSFFATETYEDEIAESYMRVNFITHYTKLDGVKTSINFRVKTDFPNTTRDLQLVIKKETSDPSDVDGSQDIGSIEPTDPEDTLEKVEYSVAMRYIMVESKRWNIYSDFGMKFDIPLNPFYKVRFRREFIYKDWNTFLIQNFNYYRQERLKESSVLEVHRKFSDTYQMTFSSSLSWTKEDEYFNLDHSLTLYQKGDDKRAYSYSIGAHALTDPTIHYDSYSAQASVRQLAYKDWFFTQFSLGSSFPKSENFDLNYFCNLTLELFF